MCTKKILPLAVLALMYLLYKEKEKIENSSLGKEKRLQKKLLMVSLVNHAIGIFYND